jgi:hypothetical protein
MSEGGVGSNGCQATVSSHTLGGLWVVDPPEAWEGLGFKLKFDTLRLGSVDIHVGASERALAITGVEPGTLDGVPLHEALPRRAWGASHPNGIVGIDHFVIVTPDFDRTETALAALGLPLRRVRDAGGFRQGFRRLGPAILELVEAQQMPPGPARFWGITFIASDLDALAARLGPDRLRPIKPAVQQGRRIATLDRAAGLKTNVASMTPES